MIRLKIRRLVEERLGITTVAEFEREFKLPYATAARFWFSSANGKEDGPPLRRPDLKTLEAIARLLGVQPGDLLEMDNGPWDQAE
jgi:hypothetical protein